MPPTTQNKRRFTFGLNVFIGVFAAVALAVLLCWLSFHSPKRWDFTHTRQYSLSEQTLTVLNQNLTEPHEVITLFNGAGDIPGRADQIQATNDLIDEYTRRSSNLRAEHITPEHEPTKLLDLFERLKKRYADKLKPVTDALKRGGDAATQTKDLAKTLVPMLNQLRQDPELTNADTRDFLSRAAQAFASLPQKVDQLIAAPTDQGRLPSYARKLNELSLSLANIDSNLASVVAFLKQPSSTEKASIGVRDQMLKIIDTVENARKPLQEAVNSLRGVEPVLDYEKLSDSLSVADPILILGPKRETVIPLEEMFRQIDTKDRDAMKKEGAPEQAFLGEERLTGALLSLSMKVRPKVVFVYAGRRPALGQGGSFNDVARRLGKLNFEVDQWTPGPQVGPMGQPGPPAPPPTAEPGQKLIWVLLPIEGANPNDPMGGQIGEQAIGIVTERLNSGDSGMIMLASSPTARFNPTDPIVQALELYNIKPQMDRIVLRETAVSTGEYQADRQLEVKSWPTDLPVTKALSGLNGLLLWSMPLEVMPDKTNKDVKVYPLVVVKMPGLWAERDLTSYPTIARKPETSADSFTIGMAAETKSNRVIVVGDPIWATDTVTTMGFYGPGTAELTGAAFPANAELFVNSMYWLAHLDELIAASPRSQDIRRVHAMSPSVESAVKWSLLAGLPMLTFFLGLGVYMVRRRA